MLLLFVRVNKLWCDMTVWFGLLLLSNCLCSCLFITNSVVIDNSVFIFCGDDNSTVDIEEYNISTRKFKKVATMKKRLSSFGISVINKSDVLIAGGYDKFIYADGGYTHKATNKCFLFNTNSKTFKDIADITYLMEFSPIKNN